MKRKKLKFLTIVFNILLLISCNKQKIHTIDTTEDIKILFNKLLINKSVMFGHQDDTAYGHDWFGEKNKSDVFSVCGDYPAIIGWDLGGIETNNSNNIDNIPFCRIKKLILEQYNRGGLNTISWHSINPVSEKDSWDKTDTLTIHKILTDTTLMKKYTRWLDNLSNFISGLKNKNGETIPIIFRPLHENTGDWFWWGKSNCSSEDFIKLWKLTIDYLRYTKNLKNILFAYSPSAYINYDEFYERYPGDDYVDIIGFDCYYLDNEQTLEDYYLEMCRMLNIINRIGRERNKYIAITETGHEGVKIKNWWTGTLLKLVQQHPITYLLVWRNAWDKPEHYYGPCPSNASSDDFVKFYNNSSTIFSRDLSFIF